jgi:hypothetical protein
MKAFVFLSCFYEPGSNCLGNPLFLRLVLSAENARGYAIAM